MNTTLKVKIKCKELSSLFLAKSDGAEGMLKQFYFDIAADLMYQIPEKEIEINATPIKNPKYNYFSNC